MGAQGYSNEAMPFEENLSPFAEGLFLVWQVWVLLGLQGFRGLGHTAYCKVLSQPGGVRVEARRVGPTQAFASYLFEV